MTGYQVDELVDITIRGARVVGPGADNHGPFIRVALTTPEGEAEGRIHCELDSITIIPSGAAELDDRMARVLVADSARKTAGLPPRHWPPQPGDLWDDGFPFGGSLWFARRHSAKIEMTSVEGDRDTLTPPAFLKHAVEIRLVYRPEDGTQ